MSVTDALYKSLNHANLQQIEAMLLLVKNEDLPFNLKITERDGNHPLVRELTHDLVQSMCFIEMHKKGGFKPVQTSQKLSHRQN